MAIAVYYARAGLNNGNSEWVSSWLRQNRYSLKFIGIGVAVVTSFYILGPTIANLIFKDKMFGSSSKRSDKFTTGLINNRNDCFANSSVQALSALPKLTSYLNDVLKQTQFLRTLFEIHAEASKQGSSGCELQELAVPEEAGERDSRPHLWRAHTSTNTIKTLSLQDAKTPNGGASEESSLNEQHDNPKEESEETVSNDIPIIPMHESLAQLMYQLQQTVTATHHISIWPFLRVIETIFKAKISTGQNDAHELTQVVLQTLEKENLALKAFVKEHSLNVIIPAFPGQGSLADHLVCLKCQQSSKVNVHDFTMYSLPVPQSINAVLSEMISENQTETIEGYSCLSCKLRAIIANENKRNYEGNTAEEQSNLKELNDMLPEVFINDDLPPRLAAYVSAYCKNGLSIADLKSTIVKKTVVVDSPDVMILHLSRSVFTGMGYQKNTCNVSFDEELKVQRQIIDNNKCVGIEEEKYTLKAIVRHQGSHSTGHYECFRHKPNFMKDMDNNQVINKTPIIDFGVASNRIAAKVWNQALNSSWNNDASSVESEESIPSNIPFRSVFPELANSAVVTDDDYVIGSSEFLDQDNAQSVSRKSSTLKRVTGFLSRKGSISVGDQGLSSPNSTNGPLIDEAKTSDISGRARFNSISSLKMDRTLSMDSSASSIHTESSTDQVSNTSTTEFETETETENTDTSRIIPKRKRRLKKLKSVLKYPWWRISDTQVKECKTSDVLSETRFVYMLYYEKV